MPGGRGRARRSCPMCKPYKFAGNNRGRYSDRETARRKALTQEIREYR